MKLQKIWVPFVKVHFFSITAIIVAGLLASFFTLLIPLSIGSFMEIVFKADSGKSRAMHLLGIHLNPSITFFFTFFCIVLVFKFIMSSIEKYFTSVYGDKFMAFLRQKAFYFFICHQQNISKKNLLVFSTDAKTMQQLLTKGIIGLLKDILFLLLSFYLLMQLQPMLTATILLLIPFFYLLQRWISKMARPHYEHRRKLVGNMLGFVAAAVENQKLDEEERLPVLLPFTVQTSQLLQESRKYHLANSILRSLSPFFFYLILTAILALVAIVFSDSGLSSGDVITYILLLMMIAPALRSVFRAEQVWMQAVVSGKKFLKYL
jgi:ABC-type multidrug transport system fused ATPase/permease subunit